MKKKTTAKRAPAPKKASTVKAKVEHKSPFRTLVVRGQTRDFGDQLKADGFSYSWTFRCWHKRGMENALRALQKKYDALKLPCGIQIADIKDEGKNPVAFRKKVSKLSKARLKAAAKAAVRRKPDAQFTARVSKAGEVTINRAELEAAIQALVKVATAS